MKRKHMARDLFVDANGFPAERTVIGGQDVIVHYVDMPDSDRTTVNGLPCTTALRTVIDTATQITSPELDRIVRDCFERRLFSRAEAEARIAEPDMMTHPGGDLLKHALARC